VGGEHALGVERLKTAKQRPGLAEGGGGRRIEERQVRGVLGAPAGKVESQARQIRIEDLGIGVGRQGAGLGLVPQAVAGARRDL